VTHLAFQPEHEQKARGRTDEWIVFKESQKVSAQFWRASFVLNKSNSEQVSLCLQTECG
jgi:hypothetical protein